MDYLATDFAHQHKQKKFTLSLITATYNRVGALKYLLKQVAKEIRPFADQVQYIISDNNSNDSTQELVCGFIKENNDLAIEYYKQKRNIGACPNIFFLYTKTTGRYVWHISDDDLLMDNAVKRLLDIIKETKDRYDIFICRVKGLWGWDTIPRMQDNSQRFFEMTAGDRGSMPYIYFSGFFSSIVLKKQIITKYLEKAAALHHTQFSTWALVLYIIQDMRTFCLIDNICVHGNKNFPGEMRIPYYHINVRGRTIVWHSLSDAHLKRNLKPYLVDLAASGWRRLAFPLYEADKEKILAEYIFLWRLLKSSMLRFFLYFAYAFCVPFKIRKKISYFLRRFKKSGV